MASGRISGSSVLMCKTRGFNIWRNLERVPKLPRSRLPIFQGERPYLSVQWSLFSISPSQERLPCAGTSRIMPFCRSLDECGAWAVSITWVMPPHWLHGFTAPGSHPSGYPQPPDLNSFGAVFLVQSQGNEAATNSQSCGGPFLAPGQRPKEKPRERERERRGFFVFTARRGSARARARGAAARGLASR